MRENDDRFFFFVCVFWIVFVVLLLSPLLLSGAERPVVNVPPEMRQGNWNSPNGYGSCVHASFITLLRWQGRYETAEMWGKNYSGGEWHTSFVKKLNKHNIRYAYTAEEDDVSFLEWACRTRRGCNVTVMGGRHMVTLVHLDEEWAGILDNNATASFIWIPRDKFIAVWKSSYSWAVTPVYTPAAPAPEYTEETTNFSRERGKHEEISIARFIGSSFLHCVHCGRSSESLLYSGSRRRTRCRN